MRTLKNQNIPFKMIQGDASHLRTVFGSIPDSARFLFPLPDGLDLVADYFNVKETRFPSDQGGSLRLGRACSSLHPASSKPYRRGGELIINRHLCLKIGKRMEQKQCRLKDARILLMNEILQGIKVVLSSTKNQKPFEHQIARFVTRTSGTQVNFHLNGQTINFGLCYFVSFHR